MTLAARMLVLGGLAPTTARRRRQVRGALASGAGVETFRAIIEAQGGDPQVVDDYGRLPAAPPARALDGAARGRRDAARRRAGRPRRRWRSAPAATASDDRVDPGVGIEILAPARRRACTRAIPCWSSPAMPRDRVAAARTLLDRAIEIGDVAGPVRPLVIGTVR